MIAETRLYNECLDAVEVCFADTEERCKTTRHVSAQLGLQAGWRKATAKDSVTRPAVYRGLMSSYFQLGLMGKMSAEMGEMTSNDSCFVNSCPSTTLAAHICCNTFYPTVWNRQLQIWGKDFDGSGKKPAKTPDSSKSSDHWTRITDRVSQSKNLLLLNTNTHLGGRRFNSLSNSMCDRKLELLSFDTSADLFPAGASSSNSGAIPDSYVGRLSQLCAMTPGRTDQTSDAGQTGCGANLCNAGATEDGVNAFDFAEKDGEGLALPRVPYCLVLRPVDASNCPEMVVNVAGLDAGGRECWGV